ncbi:hypothetical protein Taro_020046, partial [Colocasia esculenta]|nr:hypothetical protein [Colocasia esculenta]
LSQGVFVPSRTRDRAVASSLSVRPSVFRQVLQAQQADPQLADILQMPDVELNEDSETRTPWALGPILKVATGALAATWSRQSGLPRQDWRFVSRRGTVVSGGVVLVVCGARRRWPFLREGPIGCVLRVECENSMLELSEVSFERRSMPLRDWFLEGLLQNPARQETRQPRRPRPCRDGAPGRDVVATLLSVVTVAWDPHPREPVEGVLRAMSALELAATRRTLELRIWVEDKTSVDAPDRETSQQWQGARRAKETGQ